MAAVLSGGQGGISGQGGSSGIGQQSSGSGSGNVTFGAFSPGGGFPPPWLLYVGAGLAAWWIIKKLK